MANEEHLEILKQGVEVWNQWIIENPAEKIDLQGADLQYVDLRGADLQYAELRDADLQAAKLQNTKLQGAYLQGAYMQRADLRGADLQYAKLQDTNLQYARLQDTNLQGAYLQGAYLQRAELRATNLQYAELQGAYLQHAKLQDTKLQGADLRDTNLQHADLRVSNLQHADLRGVDLTEADLRYAHLIAANLSEATITGVLLHGTTRDDWIIDGIKCDYVYWDYKPFPFEDKKQEKQWELEHRVPKDRDFQPGEFEDLYKQLPTFNYFFKHGFTAFDAAVISCIVEAINERYPEFDLKLDSFHSRGQPHAKFSFLHKDDAEEVQKLFITQYEERIKALEAQKDVLMQIVSGAVSGGITVRDVNGDVIFKASKDIIAGGQKALLSQTITIEAEEETPEDSDS